MRSERLIGRIGIVGLVLGCFLTGAESAVIRAESEVYEVTTNQPLEVPTVVELGGSGAGLFSYGLAVVLESGRGQAILSSALIVPDRLAYNGPAGSGVLRASAPGFMAVKGTVDSSVDTSSAG